VVVNYETPETDYTISMTTNDPSVSCGPWDMEDLRKTLLGSGQKWRSTCKTVLPHIFVIKPTVDCRKDEWIVQYLTFELKHVDKVEVYADDVLVLSVSNCVSNFAICSLGNVLSCALVTSTFDVKI